MGAFLSTSKKEAREHEQLNKERAAARALISDSRALVSQSMQNEQRQQQFYYVGVTYYGVSMVGFSLTMLNARQRFQILQKIPWLAFTISGYLMGGQFWGLHQKYYHCQSAKLVARLRQKMNQMQEEYPHLTEYRAESSALEKLRKECQFIAISESQMNHSIGRLMLESMIPTFIAQATSEGSTVSSSADEGGVTPTDDIISQIMERNKALKNK
ncbi:catalase-peroxidase [Perkinsela sp. CCAP 1560/4]|nr:catalase-peroxidase [Perkinsela sp. CCAP 1560/4]|eukprot:KNH06631.1 catalase-peroxidase [Perkinsela sp. CCAP 1560/4]